MHSIMTRAKFRRSRRRQEAGAIALLVAAFLAVLLVVTAMVLDFGLVRIDRQVNKSAADAATTAGIQGLAGSSEPYPYRGICDAIDYLQKNGNRFSGVTAASGAWTNGNGDATANGCATNLLDTVCLTADPSTWGRFSWTGNYQGEPFRVDIQSAYKIEGSGWPEETLPAVAADQEPDGNVCGQLAVIVTQNRNPGLGSLATDSDLVSSIRSVGRVELGPGLDAPAMLLLRRSGCPILQTGSSAGGSIVYVYGARASDGTTAAGSIHADSDGSDCTGGSNRSIFLGRAAHGIVAFAAPQAGNPSLADPTKPGLITTVAAARGKTGTVIRDGESLVHSATGLKEPDFGTVIAPEGRDLVTREPVDERYLGLGSPTEGIKGAVAAAKSTFTLLANRDAAAGAGYKIIEGCSATDAEIDGISATDRVYVNCTTNSGYAGTRAIPGRTIVFAGSIKPPNTAGTAVSLPHAEKVYVFGDPTKDAIAIGNNSAFKVNTAGNTVTPSGGTCTADTDPTAREAVLVVRSGQLKQTGGLLQLCRTTVIMMGGDADACLPGVNGTAPTTAPCPAGTGDGQVSLSGGATIDWTAPNALDVTTDSEGTPTATAVAAWLDPDGPEDLALWSESAGLNSDPTYSIGGSGTMHTVGVFMAPNAGPFTIGGGSRQDLVNAQYIATSIALNGTNTSITMKVDPYAAVNIPRVRVVGLVR